MESVLWESDYIIIAFCAGSSVGQMPQIAVANRKLNGAWKRQLHRLVAVKVFEQSKVLDLMLPYCAKSPMAQMNQIAVANRQTNVCWRRMHLAYVRAEVKNILDRLLDMRPETGLAMLTDELYDVL